MRKKALTSQSVRASNSASVRQWRIRRIDIRSPLTPNAWPVVRVELDHPERGRVTDIASAPGAFDAAFLAVGQIVGLRPRLLVFNVRSIASTQDSFSFTVEVQLEIGGRLHVAKSVGVDLIRCAVEAWLSAAASGTADGEIRAYMRK